MVAGKKLTAAEKYLVVKTYEFLRQKKASAPHLWKGGLYGRTGSSTTTRISPRWKVQNHLGGLQKYETKYLQQGDECEIASEPEGSNEDTEEDDAVDDNEAVAD
ncbi:uncharacterized protein PITG_17438 [Phytophthora infestans T30-4]|uniref:Uncharacterized protein n=1 Tax=Phytophthora infestans (strain T30-4) TaxID=403677 RepID=D0NW24_PHYIT|nr:uncharacterized protein PITG_20135 [Phytophthora infestans T30-4]XP_002896195.1 uncharacterized protein PITG_19632 [Phytophthora infestans T30-4]XP_002896747.1 uncharacterized protein PITG_17438 [Phytophthora infestans T30-4]EEY52928.1 conserved hypothetical protein [Phytophthora infestans T30-4]EEY58540.1 conserved hypothetical protein [Phytophthora infestans T30-4]EEY66860.1 conserved hypothetical protein [Phytophthora infestans T30-4]|eukprot:XP_002895315.1 conserved hypothetical protein [Phytophthora infestans T30-4]